MKIMTPHKIYDGARVEIQARRLMAALSKLDLSNGIGILVEISPLSVLLMQACIRLGLRTAICPVREPIEVIRQWLKGIGITTLVSARHGSIEDAIFVDDLLHSERDALETDMSSRFFSLLRTSGTTAEPKTACISVAAHQASAQSVCNYFSYDESSTWALTLPLHHVSGLSIIFRAMHARASIYIAPTLDDLIAGINEQRISHLSLVPIQLKRLLHSGTDLSGVKAIVMGGDAMPEALRSRVYALGLNVFETYGLTETASMIWAYDVVAKSGSLLAHATMQFAYDQEIMIGGASLFDGYVNDRNECERNVCDGFFQSGDLGFIQDGKLIIDGRKHNRIISGGENIQAEEVERVLEQHPLIHQCVVVGISDREFGMRPCAVIKWRDQSLNTQDIIAYLRRHIAPYKLPKIILSWPTNAPATLKKPRRWLYQWVHETISLDKPVIVCA